MKLIWTYDDRMNKGDKTSTNRIILLNYYILSIQTAKNLGYYTILYCDESSKELFQSLVDEIHIVDSYEDTIVWDYLKVKVLEDRDDDFYLIDGDIILTQMLPEFKEDIVFDTYETANWKMEYVDTIIQLEEFGIKSEIPYWSSERVSVISTGILNLNNEYRKEYVNTFKKCNNFINQFKNNTNFHKDNISLVGGQFLLTKFVNETQLTKLNINQNMGEIGKYYTHYFGKTKFRNPIVPTDYILDTKISKKLL